MVPVLKPVNLKEIGVLLLEGCSDSNEKRTIKRMVLYRPHKIKIKVLFAPHQNNDLGNRKIYSKFSMLDAPNPA